MTDIERYEGMDLPSDPIAALLKAAYLERMETIAIKQRVTDHDARLGVVEMNAAESRDWMTLHNGRD